MIEGSLSAVHQLLARLFRDDPRVKRDVRASVRATCRLTRPEYGLNGRRAVAVAGVLRLDRHVDTRLVPRSAALTSPRNEHFCRTDSASTIRKVPKSLSKA